MTSLKSILPHNIISFPRSGQHMIERMLSEFYKAENIPYKYCEYYTCCRQIPCKYNANYQKNHDFKLQLKIEPNQKYLFLYRKNKLEQLEAFYRFKKKNKQNYKNPQEYLNLLQFCKEKIPYYNALVEKFVYNENENENILSIDYNDFLHNPAKSLHKIITFFGHNYSYDHIETFITNRKEKIQKINTKNKTFFIKLKKKLSNLL